MSDADKVAEFMRTIKVHIWFALWRLKGRRTMLSFLNERRLTDVDAAKAQVRERWLAQLTQTAA